MFKLGNELFGLTLWIIEHLIHPACSRTGQFLTEK